MSDDFNKSATLTRNASLKSGFEKLRDKEAGKGVELTDYEAQHLFEFVKMGIRAKDEIEVKRDLESTLYNMRRAYQSEGKRDLAKDIEWQNMTVRVEREKLEKLVSGHVGGQYW